MELNGESGLSQVLRSNEDEYLFSCGSSIRVLIEIAHQIKVISTQMAKNNQQMPIVR
jgi:hypothetical protein